MSNKDGRRETMMARWLAGLLVGVLVGGVAFLITIFAAGPGNGYDLPAVVLFPVTRLLSNISALRHVPVLMGVMLLQYPVYGALIGLSRSRLRGLAWIAAVHVAATVLVLYLEGWLTS